MRTKIIFSTILFSLIQVYSLCSFGYRVEAKPNNLKNTNLFVLIPGDHETKTQKVRITGERNTQSITDYFLSNDRTLTVLFEDRLESSDSFSFSLLKYFLIHFSSTIEVTLILPLNWKSGLNYKEIDISFTNSRGENVVKSLSSIKRKISLNLLNPIYWRTPGYEYQSLFKTEERLFGSRLPVLCRKSLN